jgi:hypothetical protein
LTSMARVEGTQVLVASRRVANTDGIGLELAGSSLAREWAAAATMKSRHFTTDWCQGDRRAKLPTVVGIATRTWDRPVPSKL